MDLDVRCRSVDFVYIGRRESDGGGAQVFFETMQLARSGDRHYPGMLRQQPCQCDLRRCKVSASGQAGEQIKQRLIGRHCRRRETRKSTARITALEGRARRNFAGQKPLAQRTPWHKAYAQRCACGQYVCFRIGCP